MTDPDEVSRRMAAESLAVNDPTGWFGRLYAAAESGAAVVPWDRGEDLEVTTVEQVDGRWRVELRRPAA